MFRKIQTSQGRRKYYHQQPRQGQLKSNNITRPPTSHPYSSLRNIRSHETLQSYNYVSKSSMDKQGDQIEAKNQDLIQDSGTKENMSIPKIYFHMLTEIKILFRVKEKKEEKMINSLLGNLSKKISQLYNQNVDSKDKLFNMESDLMAIQKNNEDLSKKLKRYEMVPSSNSYFNCKDRANSNNYDLVMQNVKLAHLNTSYLNKINQLQTSKTVKKVEVKKDVQENQNTEILRHLNRISYLEMKLKNSEDKEVQLNTYVIKLEEINNSLETKIEQLNSQKELLSEHLNQWRQRAMMQIEDSQMHLTRQNFLLFSIKKLRQLNKGLTQKLLNQASSEGQMIKSEIEPNPYFQYQIDFFKSIKGIYFDTKYKDFKMSLTSKKQQTFQAGNFQLQDEYMQYRRYEQINLSLYTYFMPKFYSFIQDSITTQISNTRVKGNSSISRLFIQIIRSIMRSKLNQFLMFSEEKYTRFPEFVYTWFQKFYFNSQRNDIATLEPYMQKPFSQDLFYRDLMNIKLDQSWEIITFRQFLLEELTLEQLYFYLMCQNLLFRKAGITKSKQYQGDFSILVDYNAAKLVLDMVLSDFESWNLSYLISKMRQKIIYKKNTEYIESGFFLRCLVEYYKIQRINRYKYIAKLCDEFKSEEKGLRFSSFISIINRFTEVGVDQKIQLYRECFCLGKGKITADIIFTVCSQKLVFLKYLKLKCFFKVPLLTTQASIKGMQMGINKRVSKLQSTQKQPIICLQPSDPYLYHIYSKMIELAQGNGRFHSQLQKLGSIDLLNQFTQIKKVFNHKIINNDSSLLKCRHFMHYMSEITNKIKIINFNHFYQLLEEENKKKNNQSFWIQIQESHLCQILSLEFKATMNIYEKLANYVEWKNKVYDFRLHNAARKIQKMVRKKFIAPFMQLYKIIYSQVKNGQQEPLGH